MITKLKRIENKMLFECVYDIFKSEKNKAIIEIDRMLSEYFRNIDMSYDKFKSIYKNDYIEYGLYFDDIKNVTSNLYEEYYNVTPNELSKEHIERIVMFIIIPPSILKTVGDDVLNRINITNIQKKILECAYTNFRNRAICRRHIKKLDVLICPYCNINDFSLPNVNEYKSSFQLDHFLAKDTYPFFALSIYNLVPCCGVCNQIKSKNEFKINPFIGNEVCFSIYSDEIIITTDNLENIEDLDKIKIKEKYNSDFSVVKREILEIRDIAERYNESYLNTQKIKGIGKTDYKYWIKKALRDGLVLPDNYGLYRVSKAKSEIVKVAFKDNVELYNEILND